mmetsp:Transcript_14732/g.32035  ORF Transcript_14732/g.32035 Transcript_14732/m.32035 type:complete len:348 (+) Transcript_14732:904-1947(+)
MVLEIEFELACSQVGNRHSAVAQHIIRVHVLVLQLEHEHRHLGEHNLKLVHCVHHQSSRVLRRVRDLLAKVLGHALDLHLHKQVVLCAEAAPALWLVGRVDGNSQGAWHTAWQAVWVWVDHPVWLPHVTASTVVHKLALIGPQGLVPVLPVESRKGGAHYPGTAGVRIRAMYAPAGGVHPHQVACCVLVHILQGRNPLQVCPHPLLIIIVKHQLLPLLLGLGPRLLQGLLEALLLLLSLSCGTSGNEGARLRACNGCNGCWCCQSLDKGGTQLHHLALPDTGRGHLLFCIHLCVRFELAVSDVHQRLELGDGLVCIRPDEHLFLQLLRRGPRCDSARWGDEQHVPKL